MRTINRTNLYREKQRKKEFILKAIAGVLILLLVAIAGVFFFCIKRNVTIEYGQNPNPDMFIRFNLGPITLEGLDDPDLLPGKHTVKVTMGPFVFKCLLTVLDTQAPEVTLTKIETGYGKELPPENFILDIKELSEYSVAYESSPNWSLIGTTQDISIKVVDVWGNETLSFTTLLIENYPLVVEVELGSGIEDIHMTLVGIFGEVTYKDISLNDINTVVSIPLGLNTPKREYDIELSIVDTIPPTMKVRDVVAPVGFETDPKVFVEEASDLSPIEISFDGPVDFSKEGSFDVTIKAMDSSGNETLSTSKLSLIKDNEAPVFEEAKDFDSFIGDNIIFREMVKVSDNCTEDPKLKVEASAVNINQKGEYTVLYTATDLAGNEASATLKVTVRNREEEKKELEKRMTEIAGRILTEGMTKMQQAEAIYTYLFHNITYVSRPKTDFVKAALEATNGRGGCYNYASLAQFLLDYAGIKNMFMETDVHYWNIIDIDDGHGWYHFDATPSPGLPKIFLWTDAQMMEYSESQNRTHHYDRSKYPEIP